MLQPAGVVSRADEKRQGVVGCVEVGADRGLYVYVRCNRCQDVCPAYVTGKELSPSAHEINKRYLIRDEFGGLAEGKASEHPLMGFTISESAVWACTACGACVDICPVGNEPMFDILDIRRDLVLTQGEAGELQGAFTNMEKRGNPWGVSASRLAWAEGLDVPTVEENPNFDVLYWTGCAVSYDDRAKKTARDFVKVLKSAGVNFAVLGDAEVRERVGQVEVIGPDGRPFAKGIARRDASSVRATAGMRSADLPDGDPEVIHRDDLVVLPQ